MIRIVQVVEPEEHLFSQMTTWMYDWWGNIEGYTKSEILHTLQHSICKHRLPQTFVAYAGKIPVGMYQLSYQDLNCRPDLYPWLCNVYVVPEYRNKGIFRTMMLHVPKSMKQSGIQRLYLFTTHDTLYEKFGWTFIEPLQTFLPIHPIQRLYRYDLKEV